MKRSLDMLDATASDLPSAPVAPTPVIPFVPLPPVPEGDPAGDPPARTPPLNSLVALQNYRFVGSDPRMEAAGEP